MKRLVQFGVCALAVAAFALVSGTQAEAKGKCSKKSASAIGITQELAKGFAKVALDTEIGFAGAKGKGPTKYKCQGDLFAECKASQLACK
jgi:hypothetical protein